jgi:2-oxoisovalerate dehydrogenase E2 component (dihydrolipoyl transacylase)
MIRLGEVADADFRLPDLGEGLTEGEIVRWLVAVNDQVELNQPLVEVETAKAAVEIPSPYAGVVIALLEPEGATVAVGTPIIRIGSPGDAEPATTDISEGKAPEARSAVLVGYGPRAANPRRGPRRRPGPPAVDGTSNRAGRPESGGGVLAKPPLRKLARELGVDLAGLAGTGRDGVITREDVRRAAETTGRETLRGETRIPVKGVRKATAAAMVASAFTAPHVTEFLTVDVTATMTLCGRTAASREFGGVKVTPLLFVAKAALTAIRRHPMINSSWDEARQEIVVKDEVNLGIAAATPRGLLVPNIKNANRLTLHELAQALSSLVETARNGGTAPGEMAGGTFTITNIGVFGVDAGTPILNPGEAAILCMGAVRQEPWVHDGQIVPRQVMRLSLSFDHRIIDGALGSRFLADIGAALADPACLIAWN